MFFSDEGAYDNSSYMVWQTPEMLYLSTESQKIKVGLNGELAEQQVAEERGFIVKRQNVTIQINIPYNTEGGSRKVRLVWDT